MFERKHVDKQRAHQARCTSSTQSVGANDGTQRGLRAHSISTALRFSPSRGKRTIVSRANIKPELIRTPEQISPYVIISLMTVLKTRHNVAYNGNGGLNLSGLLDPLDGF